MANYLEQIPKQLAARRKAFNAAKSNPALLPSCWAIVRSIANNMYDYARNAAIGGCTFPDRPMYLSEDDAAFLNFGTTPTLLKTDTAWREAEETGKNTADIGPDNLSTDRLRIVRRQLSQVAGTFAHNHAATRVYNLEPWLQDMYRDRLDVDFAEDLQRQIDALNAYMDSVPKSISATGLNARLAKGVMDAFTLFKTITGSSHQLDREKSSFVDRRSYVNTIQKIELIMQKADESLGSAVAGRSVVREMFGLWKDANYEMMALTRQLRALWAGTSLDDRIQELADLLSAIQSAINRCSEESATPTPQLPVFLGDDEKPPPLSRVEITEIFRETILYDMVASSQATLQVREIRKYGPLAVVITPGFGDPRYCSEIRKLGADEDDPRKKKEVKAERDIDVDRRIRYPLNCVVVPLSGNKETFPEKMADAWLEYNQAAFPVQFKEFLEAAKAAAPEIFQPPEDKDAKTVPPTYARQMLGRLVALFVRWAHSGEEPDPEAFPGFEPFREVVLSRLKSDDFLIPTRYRPFVELFAEAGPKRRGEMWKRNLGTRFALDRQLIAASILMKDWDAVEENLNLLSLEVTKENAHLQNAFAKMRDTGDPFGEHKAISFFRKFLTELPDLKSALLTVESQVAIEVETLRTQAESLGKVFQYDQASETMMRRQLSQIQEKRMAANAHIDHHLIGLMYAVSGNLVAAESALSMCLVPLDQQDPDDCPPPPAPEEVDEEWFKENLAPKDGKFPKRDVAGESSPGTASYNLVYYNLGIVYMKLQKYTEARMCFKALLDETPPEKSHLYRQWAEAHMEEAKEKAEAGKKEQKK